MPTEITITTGSRLHFGLLVRGAPANRSYGGIGLMIDQPCYRLSLRAARSDQITAAPATAQRIDAWLPRLRGAGHPGPWQITVHEEIPTHAGLGSGTQLGLALATAVCAWRSQRQVDLTELARLTGRGARSQIGTAGFLSGGMIWHGIDPAGPEPQRLEFPADWRLVLVTPTDHQGLSGDEERQTFRAIPPMNEGLCRILNQHSQDLFAATQRTDFASASQALSEFGRLVGEYFAPYQAGVFASPRMAALAGHLRSIGITGFGQTSWGPTLFALCAGAVSAEQLAREIRQSSTWGDCRVRVAAALNRGATVEAR